MGWSYENLADFARRYHDLKSVSDEFYKSKGKDELTKARLLKNKLIPQFKCLTNDEGRKILFPSLSDLERDVENILKH